MAVEHDERTGVLLHVVGDLGDVHHLIGRDLGLVRSEVHGVEGGRRRADSRRASWDPLEPYRAHRDDTSDVVPAHSQGRNAHAVQHPQRQRVALHGALNGPGQVRVPAHLEVARHVGSSLGEAQRGGNGDTAHSCLTPPGPRSVGRRDRHRRTPAAAGAPLDRSHQQHG